MKDNPYLQMPLSRVRADAAYGVSLARTALRQRDPKWADALHIGIEPDDAHKARIFTATSDYLSQKSKRT